MSESFKDGIPRETRKTGFLQSFDRQKLNPADSADFASKILSFVRSNRIAADALIAGNVQMLGFESLKEQFGPNWHSIKDKVHLLTEGIIKSNISSSDVYLQMGDDKFVILFGKATRPEADAVARKVGREVNAKLNGAGAGMEAVSVRPVTFEVPRDDPAPLQDPIKLEQSVEEAQREAEKAEEAKVEAAKDRMVMRFWPVANVRKRLVSCYHADLHVPEDLDLGTGDDDEGSATGAVEAALDRMVLEHAGKALAEATARKMRALLVVPVHFETLAVKGFRDAYIETCKLLPRIAEHRLMLMVRKMDDDVPQGRLHTVFTYLSPYFAGFVGEFSLGFRRADKLGGVGMVAISIDGSLVAPTPDDLAKMKAFSSGNKKIKMRRYFYGAQTFDAATAARRCGFDYVQGPGVAPSMPIHGKVFNI
jgi:GGDEF domain-containing protein/EAL domain-containing protein (putative c-di-GMP-specific phosphodiesterase class I)